jgi:hypothetical protein
MTETVTSQNIDLSSWDTLYMELFYMGMKLPLSHSPPRSLTHSSEKEGIGDTSGENFEKCIWT